VLNMRYHPEATGPHLRAENGHHFTAAGRRILSTCMYTSYLGTRQNGTSPITIPLVYETAHAHVGAVTSGTRSGRTGSLFLRRRRPAPTERKRRESLSIGEHHLMVSQARVYTNKAHEQKFELAL
jgi:hypothetical protein